MQNKTPENKVHIGKVIDAHGIRGDIYCLIFSGDSNWISKLKVLSLSCSQKTQNFDVKKIKAFKKGFIATLENLNDRNQAEEYKGCEVWVEASLFVSRDGESLYLSELLKFSVIDRCLGQIGIIETFSSNAWQDLLVLTGQSDEDKMEATSGSNGHSEKNGGQGLSQIKIEIPFVKEFVTQIDYANKIVYMNLPEGLLEINTQGSHDQN